MVQAALAGKTHRVSDWLQHYFQPTKLLTVKADFHPPHRRASQTPLPNQLPHSRHLALATLTPWLFLLPPFTSSVPPPCNCDCSPPSLHSSRAGLSLTNGFCFAIIPEGRIPGPALRGGPLIIVGRPLFLGKHNEAFWFLHTTLPVPCYPHRQWKGTTQSTHVPATVNRSEEKHPPRSIKRTAEDSVLLPPTPEKQEKKRKQPLHS